ncbi:hypothetical protein KXD93_21200 [Mucilaginibacter sp. BJC16-A38]|uniref:hypothetical protein n=1 Tax=Mucilaginibacter phenanthrenivorans TaxID=1234842 RepID=UPI0021577831|nr:hypothetical protein [Mucilaginibacter phenanthrenivorans]MCR8560183.1 hypothetical protein [Mucilaginibacter phenanthrenivorans]
MRRIYLTVLLMGSVAILLTAMNQSFINKVKQDRYFDHLTPEEATNHSFYHKVFVRSDHWRYGDLYGLCFLPAYKFKLEPFRKYPHNDKLAGTNRVLYIIGDSYLADKELDGAFKGFDRVVFLDDRFPFGPLALDSNKQNFLILEFAERNLNGYDFKKTSEAKWTSADLEGKLNFQTGYQPVSGAAGLPANLWERINRILFNKDLSRNLELLLFDDRAFTPLKEMKAAFNYKITGSLPKEVAVSTDKSRLLMNATIDPGNKQSAFRQIGSEELDGLLGNLQQAQQYYRAIGFKTVSLAIIPNPVSIYDAKRMTYNHLLERVEKKTTLPVISIWDDFKKAPQNLYYRSDTHWNPSGMDSWITEVNKKQIYRNL